MQHYQASRAADPFPQVNRASLQPKQATASLATEGTMQSKSNPGISYIEMFSFTTKS